MFLLEVHLNHFFKPNMQETLELQEKLNNDVSLYSKPFYTETAPNSDAPFSNFGAPLPNMFNPNYNPNMPNTFMSNMQSIPVLQPHNFSDKDCFEALLKVIKSLKNDPKAVDVVSVLLSRMFPVQDSRLDSSLRLLTANVGNQLRIDFSEEESKEILQAIEAYLERWVSILDGQNVQPPPQLELKDWEAIMEACGTELNSLTETRLLVKKLILIIAKSKVFACEKFDLSQLVLDASLSFSPQPLMELKERVKQVIATWPKKSWADTLVKLYDGDLFSQDGTSNKKLSEDKDVKKPWLRDFNEKFDDIVESAMKAYSEYYKRKLGEVQGRDASILIDSNNFKELLDLFGEAFPDDLNFKCGKALHLYVQGMDTDYRTRMSVLEAICGVKTLDQKTNDGDDNKVNHRPEL